MESKTFILHDESINTYGFRMLTSGADLSVFEKNPVMFYNHDDYSMPIGKWNNVRIEGDKILADAIFDEDDEMALRVCKKVKNGYLNAASIGAWALEFSDDPSLMMEGQKGQTVTKWLVREASICAIGANHHAVALYDSSTNQRINLSDKSLPIYGTINNSNNNSKTMNIRKLFGLSDAASEDAIGKEAEKVVNEKIDLEKENEKLKAELQKANEREAARKEAEAKENETAATALVDAAIKDARINADGRAMWLADFAKDFAGAKARLSSIATRESIAGQVNHSQTNLSDLAKLSWKELDKQGKLQLLKDTDAAMFKDKFKAEFGVDYVEE